MFSWGVVGELVMGIADKIKSSKDDRVKAKRIRFGNVKDFHGRRQHGENVLIQEETKHASESSKNSPMNLFSQEPIPSYSTFFPSPQETQKTTFLSKLLDESKQTNRPNNLSERNKFSFDAHMTQWAQDFRKPLATPSTNVEFNMPYCYSEGLYSKVSAESFLKQPFNSIGELSSASELWSPQVDSWHEKSQLALQYYRHLCEQPSRMPLQTITVKKTIAQFAAEQCALLGTGMYFEMFYNSGIRIGNIVFEEKNESMLYHVPEHLSTLTPSHCSGIRDGSIFTSSWQN